MIKQIHFFAANDDLSEALALIESSIEVEYYFMGDRLKSGSECEARKYSTFHVIPGFGVAEGRQMANCDSYLIVDRLSGVKIRNLNLSDGRKVGVIDQLENNCSVVLTIGGRYFEDGNVVIRGCMASAYDSEFSKKVMKLFMSGVKKRFVKIKSFYVGPVAHDIFRAGGRLICTSIDSPRIFDLTDN